MTEAKRRRRAFTAEFKAETVRLVRTSGKSISAIARELDLAETALRRWVHDADGDAGRGPAGPLTSTERAELAELRRENTRLRMERDILKKCMVRPRRCKRDQRTGAPSAPMYSASVWGAKDAPGQDGNPHAPVLKSHTASGAAFFIRVSGAPSGR
jgi:transposase